MILQHNYFSLSERPIKFSSFKYSSLVPGIQICNLNKFSSETFGTDDIPTVDEYADQVDKFKHCPENMTCLRKPEQIIRMMKNTIGYFQYIGPHNARRLTNTLEESILLCTVIMDDGITTLAEPCDEIVEVTKTINENFLECIDISVPTEQSNFMKTGM